MFPSHISLILEHNDHLIYYRSVANYIEEGRYRDWVSEDEKQKAISSGQCWRMTWFPATPNGHCELCASSLDVLLKAAQS